MNLYQSRFAANAKAVAEELPDNAIAVLKGDGYGFGLDLCAKTIATCGYRRFMVATTTEASTLRAHGCSVPIIVAGAGRFSAEGVSDIEWLVGEPEIRRLSGTSAIVGLRVHIDVDFGIGRGGVHPTDLDRAMTMLQRAGVEIAGLAGHLPGNVTAGLAIDAQETLVSARHRCPRALLHLGGSDAIQWVHLLPHAALRMGRLLFGVRPRDLAPDVLPAVTTSWAWQAAAIPYLPPRRTGYAAAPARPGRPFRIEAGFAHGLPPQAAGNWPVCIGGIPYLIQEVFMLSSIAYPLCDTTQAPATTAVALLAGRNELTEVPIRSIAQALGMPTTAVLAAPRVPRRAQP
ncbi:alanine racemase [Hamadaea sp. NPDC051192]|uniref:alanine racemase n=1 Tax=Hamadaea sp. NPDC051192 TaxID=3154940 RepID=UPI003423F815